MRRSAARDALVNAPFLRTVRRHLVPQSFRDWVKEHWRMHERPRLPAHKRGELEEVFDADLALLGTWLGRDLSCASFERLTDESPPEWSPEAAELAT